MHFLSFIILFVTVKEYKSVQYKDKCNEGFTRVFKPASPKSIYMIKDCSQVTDIQKCVNNFTDTVHPELDFVNFDDFAEQYIRCVAGNSILLKELKLNPELQWIDLYGKEEELQTAIHKGMHLKASVQDLKYRKLERTLQEKPEILLIKWLHNNQSEQEISAKISEEVEKTIVTSYSVTHGVEISVEIEWDAIVSGSISAEYSFEKETEESVESKKTFKLEDTVEVPAHSSVKVLWLITEAKVKQEWTADLHIDGWMAFKYSSPAEIWFLPVGDMGYYFREFFSKSDSYTLKFQAKGTESAPQTVDSQVSTWQFDLQNELPCAE